MTDVVDTSELTAAQVVGLFRTGALPAIKTTRGWRVSREAVDGLLRSRPAHLDGSDDADDL